MNHSPSIIERFQDTYSGSRPMVRYWFPDASADYAVLRAELTDLYNAGFAGIEVAHVPRYAEYDPAEFGWGTPKWRELMKETLRIAHSFERPFQVDFTSTPHWPIALNTIDPNDDSASMELAYVFARISGGGVVDLPMPEKRLSDFMNAPFIFQDTFLAAVVGRIAEIRPNGDVVLDDDTLRDVSEFVTATGDTTPAGVPDLANPVVAAMYRGVTMDLDGGRGSAEQRGVPVSEEGIKHLFGGRERLRNAQEYYRIDLDAAGAASSPGDWLLFGFYRRGTGQALGNDTKIVDKGRYTYPINTSMAEVPYVIDHFSREGARETQKFWEREFLADAELRDLLRKSGGSLFEDSIETMSSGPFWSRDFLDFFRKARGYDLTPRLPLILWAERAASPKITPYDATHFLSRTGAEKRFAEDYFLTLNDMYRLEYVESMMEWSHRELGRKYRAQSYHTQGITIDTGRLALALDIAEGESLAWGSNYDRFRVIAGGVHVSGHRYFTDEVIADNGGASYRLTWKSSTNTLNNNFISGVNLMILHGASYAAEAGGRHSAWPAMGLPKMSGLFWSEQTAFLSPNIRLF